MHGKFFIALSLAAVFVLQGCNPCEKMEAASAHIHEAGKPCTGLTWDYEEWNALDTAACFLVLQEAGTEDNPFCGEAVVDVAECQLKIETCDPANKDAFYAKLRECDQIYVERCR